LGCAALTCYWRKTFGSGVTNSIIAVVQHLEKPQRTPRQVSGRDRNERLSGISAGPNGTVCIVIQPFPCSSSDPTECNIAGNNGKRRNHVAVLNKDNGASHRPAVLHAMLRSPRRVMLAAAYALNGSLPRQPDLSPPLGVHHRAAPVPSIIACGRATLPLRGGLLFEQIIRERR